MSQPDAGAQPAPPVGSPLPSLQIFCIHSRQYVKLLNIPSQQGSGTAKEGILDAFKAQKTNQPFEVEKNEDPALLNGMQKAEHMARSKHSAAPTVTKMLAFKPTFYKPYTEL